MVQVSCIVWGWALAQYPYLLPPDLTYVEAAAPPITLELVLGALMVGAVVLIPSLYYLFRIFKSPAGLMLQLDTERLRLLPLSSTAIDALLAGDGARLRALTGATFPAPVRPPPLTEELLPMVRDKVASDAAQEGWWTWVVVRKDTERRWARWASAAVPMPKAR